MVDSIKRCVIFNVPRSTGWLPIKTDNTLVPVYPWHWIDTMRGIDQSPRHSSRHRPVTCVWEDYRVAKWVSKAKREQATMRCVCVCVCENWTARLDFATNETSKWCLHTSHWFEVTLPKLGYLKSIAAQTVQVWASETLWLSCWGTRQLVAWDSDNLTQTPLACHGTRKIHKSITATPDVS